MWDGVTIISLETSADEFGRVSLADPWEGANEWLGVSKWRLCVGHELIWL